MTSSILNAIAPCARPQGLGDQCCGMLFNSRGFKAAADLKGAQLEQALLKASQVPLRRLVHVCDDGATASIELLHRSL